jgi:FkbM family methyltransferase
VIAQLATSPAVRRVYDACRRVPMVGPALHRCMLAILPLGTRVWTQMPNGRGKGLWILADPRFDENYLTGEHEMWLQDILQKHLKPGDCFYDVGAHVGFFSMIAARLVGHDGHVVAFEPDKSNANLLRTNLARNHLNQVALIQSAVWSRSGTISFERSDTASGGMEGHVVDGGPQPGARPPLEIPCVALDEVVATHPAPNFIKLDVEGAESEALGGAAQLFRIHHPGLLCEVHDETNSQFVREWLHQRGYEFSWVENDSRLPRHLLALPVQGSAG